MMDSRLSSTDVHAYALPNANQFPNRFYLNQF